MIRETIIKLGNSIDMAYDNRDALSLEKLIDEAENYKNANLNPDEMAVLNYFLGNAWSDLDIIRNNNTESVWWYNRVEHLNSIKYFRKCVGNSNVSDTTKKNIFIQSFTNLGIMFSQSGRVVYAIESWKKALDIAPSFGMAGANLCHGLFYYANSLYDPNHRAIILRHCHNELMLFLRCEDIHEKARVSFESDLSWIRKTLSIEFLQKNNRFREYSLGRSKKEKNYRKWVLDNALYLNPLNDIYHDSAIAHDILHLPNMMVRNYEAPVFHGFFNEIKQEYITSRYLYFQYKEEIPEHIVHYSDKGRNLTNTLDYPQYGYRFEQLKNAFKTLYSIFDKIAYFINEYFELREDRNKVYFRSIWYKNRGINPVIESQNNNPLRGLYFLSKDFYSNDIDYLELTDPDAKDMAHLRNHLEHKYFKMHWIKPNNEDDLRFDNLAYSIDETDFERKTYRLLKCAREAVIYLSLAVHVKEKRNDVSDDIVMPLHMIGYD